MKTKATIAVGLGTLLCIGSVWTVRSFVQRRSHRAHAQQQLAQVQAAIERYKVQIEQMRTPPASRNGAER
jgi:Tfp pilus assembly protein PilE